MQLHGECWVREAHTAALNRTFRITPRERITVELPQDLKREMYSAMIDLLGRGYVSEYYMWAAQDFINIAEEAMERAATNDKQRSTRRVRQSSRPAQIG